MTKILYEILHKCDGCDEEKKTTKVDHLDICHRHIEHHLCRKCDTSTGAIRKIMDRNRRLYGQGDPFGFKEGCKKFTIIGDEKIITLEIK